MIIKKNSITAALTFLIIPQAYAYTSETAVPKKTYPAVSNVNVKSEISTGVVNDDTMSSAAISVTTPLGHALGIQIDGAYGGLDGNSFYGAGGQIFWRAPEKILLGITGMRAEFKDKEKPLYRIGIIAEYYLENFTVLSSIGLQITDNQRDKYGSIGLNYYASKKFTLGTKLAGFGSYYNFQINTEYRPEVLAGGSLFINSGIDNDNNGFITTGYRFSFGSSPSSLKKRDRYDDPVNLVTDLMNTSATKIFDSTKTSTPSVPAILSSGGGGGGGGMC